MPDTTLTTDRSQRIAELVRAGVLPTASGHRPRSGCGTGRTCVVCDEAIAADDLEIKLEHVRGRTVPLHLECFMDWWALTQPSREQRAV
jgi:hypothetical protein